MEEIKEQLSLKFHGVDFVDVRFSSESRYVNSPDFPVDIKIQPRVFYPKDHPTEFKIVMEVYLKAKDAFVLKTLAVGNFELNQEIIGEIKKGFINVNAPAIMFPYIRAFISNLTSNLGSVVRTITIPPHFFPNSIPEIPNDEIEAYLEEE